MTSDPKPGDVQIEFVTDAGQRRAFVLRPSFAAIVEIEEQTGRSIFALARRIAKTELGHHETGCIVTAGLKAGGEAVSYDVVGDMVLRTGLVDVLPAVGEFLTKVLSGTGQSEDAVSPPQPESQGTAQP